MLSLGLVAGAGVASAAGAGTLVAAETEDVECDVDDRHFGEEGRRRVLATEPRLEGDEGQDRPVAPRQQLPVEDPVPAEVA